jgi:hypothetical protein
MNKDNGKYYLCGDEQKNEWDERQLRTWDSFSWSVGVCDWCCLDFYQSPTLRQEAEKVFKQTPLGKQIESLDGDQYENHDELERLWGFESELRFNIAEDVATDYRFSQFASNVLKQLSIRAARHKPLYKCESALMKGGRCRRWADEIVEGRYICKLCLDHYSYYKKVKIAENTSVTKSLVERKEWYSAYHWFEGPEGKPPVQVHMTVSSFEDFMRLLNQQLPKDWISRIRT